MSLVRAALFAGPRSLGHLRPHRCYSDDHHDHAHHGGVGDVEYPTEELSWTFWRNSIILALACVGFWKFAPAPDDNSYFTRWISMYRTPTEEWTKVNLKKLLMAEKRSEGHKLISDARLPPVYRYRYPQRFDNHSTHRIPVGTSVDLSDLVVKTAKEQP